MLLFAQDGTVVFAIVAVVLGFILLLVALVIFAFAAQDLRLFIQCWTAGANIGLFDIVFMRFRGLDPAVIVRAKITAIKAGLDERTSGITREKLEAHALSRGRVLDVVSALVSASKAKTIALDYDLATRIDLAGRNLKEAVRTSVYPKVIDCPADNSSRATLDAVAKNGVQLKVRARVTVRSNLKAIIGGAGEETIVARVGEGIVSAIGSSENHLQVLANPDRISKTVLARKLDSQTAFEIVSIDIADLDVGENIGARLQADQAEADTRVARARAEQRRAAAIALEQENVARIEEARAKLVESEAEVPKAIADSFQTGMLSIMDYYKFRNIQADTDMRQSIARSGSNSARSQ